MLLISICTGGGYVGVYGCCNQGMAAVWVVVFSFLLLVLIVLSTLLFCACWLLCDACFILCGRVSDFKAGMEWTGIEGWGRGNKFHTHLSQPCCY